MTLLRLLAALLALTLSASCVLQTWHMAELPDQSVPLTSPELSRIYVMRTPLTKGNLRRMFVFDDEQQIGSLNEDEFLCWERRPGVSRLSIFYERPKDEGGELQTVIDLPTEAGQVVYYTIELDADNRTLLVTAVPPDAGPDMIAQRYASETL